MLPLVFRTATIDDVKLALDDAVADPEVNFSGIAVTDAVAVFVANASLTRKADDVDDSDADNIASEILIISALDDVVLAHDVLALDDVVLSAVDVTDAVALDVPDAFVINSNDAVALVMLADAVADPNNIFLAADVVVAEDDVDADPSITKTPAEVKDADADAEPEASFTNTPADVVDAEDDVDAEASFTDSPVDVKDADADIDAEESLTFAPVEDVDDVADAVALAFLVTEATDTIVADVVTEPMASVISPSKPKTRTP